MKSKKKGRVGSSFGDFLKGEGTYAETRAIAIGRVIAWRRENTAAPGSRQTKRAR